MNLRFIQRRRRIAAASQRAAAPARPPLDLRPYVGGVTMAEAGRNLNAAFALLPKRDSPIRLSREEDQP